ncbi:hypothetical protein ND856_14060 [Leptospira bandrabouensis]|uniref:hypothetical protein n=1 Tax=Leptospira bandrabouensis TaxID=2484903 RepID=UPI00223D8964|nr:hypothetical protein [Leptospira bandrabouensis]MCW7459567.1 hypothetical protein [Leptospira bandrabouensis]MCW7478415.1 hypothetical protein [Leptospira bandrabouensis]MCW7486301.1 hypothetical protein [Leptospira bandrabouensis]
MDVVEGDELKKIILEFQIREKLRGFELDYRRKEFTLEVLVHRYAEEILLACSCR